MHLPSLSYNWEDIKDEHGLGLIIGQFHFTKRENEGFTASNKCRDVLAAIELSTKLLLEESTVLDSHSKINDSLMKLIKITSAPNPDHGPINNKSFGRLNEKFVHFFIDMLSLQLVFDNWYPFAAQVAPLPYSKSTHIEVSNALQRNSSILVSLTVSINASSQSFYMENGYLGGAVPSLKQLFSFAVKCKKKFQKEIISSWEGYNNNHVSLTISLHSICISGNCMIKPHTYAIFRIVCGFITG